MIANKKLLFISIFAVTTTALALVFVYLSVNKQVQNTPVARIFHQLGIREDKPIITLNTQCLNQNQDVVIEGEAVVMVPVE